MIKIKYKRITVIFLFIMVFLGLWKESAITTNATSTKKQALSGYAQMMEQPRLKVYDEGSDEGDNILYINTKKLSFALAYIDNDSIPEMIVRRADGSDFGLEFDAIIYTWNNGKVKRLHIDPFGEAFQVTGYYKKTGVFIDHGAYGETMYIKLSNGKTKRKMFSVDALFSEEGKNEYYGLNGKRMSKSKFKHQLDKLVKHKKQSRFVFHKNTVKNRKKYLSKASVIKKKNLSSKKWYKKVLRQRSGRYKVKCWNINRYDQFQYIYTDLSEYWYYYLRDVNKDGIKELFLSVNPSGQGYGSKILILTYHNKKIKPLIAFANLRGGIYLKGKNVYANIGGSKEGICRGFKLRHGKLKKVLKMEHYTEENYNRVYKKNNKRIGETEYNRIVDNIFEKRPIYFRYIPF